MKKLQYILLALVLVLASCNNKDSIWNVMGDMDSRVSTLETLCQEMNTNIAALETLIKAQNNGDYITNVTEIRNGNTIVGYTITFNHHDPITIYNGTNGKDGRDGVDGYKPIVGAKQDTDGVYYWTVDGNWLTDANGNKIRVTGEKGDKGDKGDTGDKGQDGKDGTDGTDGTNGVNGNTPQLKIENNYWYISYDGTNWTQLGKATGDKGDKGDSGESIFKSVTQDDDYIYFTLADNTIIKIAQNGNGNSQPNSEFMFEVTYDANGGVGAMPKDTFYYGISKSLAYCGFSKVNCNFKGWNTKQDGSGISYMNCQAMMVNKNIILYAQWISSHPGGFSVSPTKQVKFAPGNLQYKASANIWRFAEHQYDYIGDANNNISSTYDGWIDLFGWGTGNNPTNKSDDYKDYQTFVDWGINTVGAYSPNTWRTLSGDEWSYLYSSRLYADSLYGVATINGIHGMILLPDNWLTPLGIRFDKGFSLEWNLNIYTAEEWEILENAGAVFLPAAGNRDTYWGDIRNIQNYGFYWSNSIFNVSHSNSLYFTENTMGCSPTSRDNGLSVRLVQDVN